MRSYQKVIVSILVVLVVGIIGLTIYGMQIYQETNATFNQISKSVDRKTDKRETAISIEERDPFSILLMGIDTGALGRTEQGRSDSMMVVTVNPEKKQSTIVSLDRDIYTQIVGYNTIDKLNHAYAFGGEAMAMDSVENLLDIPIDHYVTINMQGMRDLICAIITCTNHFPRPTDARAPERERNVCQKSLRSMWRRRPWSSTVRSITWTTRGRTASGSFAHITECRL